MKKLFPGGALSIFFGSFIVQNCSAQLSLSAQLRTRTELRDGQGSPLPKDAKPALFTSQRTRLTAGFSNYRIRLGLTLQDVRVWGQDVSTINRVTTADNNGFLMHEAWAEVLLTDTIVKNKSLQLKIGRQELVYDDSRLLGNLDWLQQGRRHDAAVLKYKAGSWNLHLGGAFNQNKENASGTVYNAAPPGNYPANTNGGTAYKGLEFLHVNKQLGKSSLSLLFLADQFSKYYIDSLSVKQWEAATHQRFTTGFYFSFRNTLTAAAYYQTGHNATGKSVNAALLSLAYQHHFSERFSAEAGADYTTDDFDPLYGTPHKFWGAMDYFYVASGFGNKGLQDYYLKAKFRKDARWMISADAHQFYSAAMSKKFGTEADLTVTYNLTRMIGFEGGYSHFWSTAWLTSPGVKNVADAQSNSNWAYLSINIKPELFFKSN